jgi:hypothetical protein
MHLKIIGRKNQMLKIINHGLAKRDDPIYSGGLAMSFNRPSIKSTDVTATSTAGEPPPASSAAPERVDPAIGAVQVMQQRFGKPSTSDNVPD